MLWWQSALFLLPYASLALSVMIALLTGLAIRDRTIGRSMSIYYLLVALALFAFNLVVLV
jgi:hypothetical protein